VCGECLVRARRGEAATATTSGGGVRVRAGVGDRARSSVGGGSDGTIPSRLDPNDPRCADAATAHAIRLAVAGRHPDAAVAFVDALTTFPSPAAGWILPVEPLLHTAARPSIWADALAIVRQRAV